MGKVGISFAIGGSIAAVIMVIGMITIVADTATPTGTFLNMHGYYIVTVTDSEGNIKSISQGYNNPTHLLKDCLFDGYFAATGPTATVAALPCSVASAEIAVGDGGETDAGNDARTDLGHRYSVSGNGTAVQSAATSSVASETTIVFNNGASPITISQTDLDFNGLGNAGDDGPCIQVSGGSGVDCFMDEVALFDNAGNMLSRADITTSVEVSVGDQVDITLTITLT